MEKNRLHRMACEIGFKGKNHLALFYFLEHSKGIKEKCWLLLKVNKKRHRGSYRGNPGTGCRRFPPGACRVVVLAASHVENSAELRQH